jgi:hypothetical protein
MLQHDIVLERFIEIVTFPLNNPSLIPSLIPVLVGLLVLELYFGRYTKEELGWNTAVGNATMLVTTSLTLIYEEGLLYDIQSSGGVVAFTILGVGLLILTLNFYHIWPKMLAFNVSSAFIVYVLVYLTMALTYGDILIDANTIFAGALVFIALFWMFTIIQSIETSAD